ncbi:hypothetical protein FOXG_22718 [Fusarium oxysporum f. sp. lycopersici 4287]|uniref:Uncharacterized protein n=1 Tax=Fusarium oxysporum f. sp. lycopersici (strain 4287 / CBS 123668 / FGSC 9935 / NRRL 34936) TaxID=426428 RepID=A0A0J9WVS0_FUSO4|nr:hypothetical protein FOXG_22718 [Fusarium oxysporum f. sp. lycopersici 4287]EWZ78914.1 hypothetical protein FOWG_16919 [Fusarium oxysporum f. sp. lycopersici MN25]KNB20017.1 hypothetical protein FOXG_22718 [Fusarium oxysporum f. sp. lycopersici 4287]
MAKQTLPDLPFTFKTPGTVPTMAVSRPLPPEERVHLVERFRSQKVEGEF